MNRQPSRTIASVLLALSIVVLGMSATAPPGSAALEVDGNTYTSPTYGYTIAWQLPWFFVHESSAEGEDVLVLSDGVSSVVFSSLFNGDSDPYELLRGLMTEMGSSLTHAQPVLDESGSPMAERDATSASAIMSGTIELGNGSTADVNQLVEVRIRDDGVSLFLIATAPVSAFAGYLDRWEALFAGINAPVDSVGNESPDTLIVDGPNDTSVRFNFDVDVAGPDREWIAEGIRLAQDFVAAEFSDPMWEDVTVTVLPTGAPSDPGRIANTVAGSIAIYTGGEMAWAVAPPPERIRAVVHEYVHVYQYSLLDAELGVEVFANAPGWFVEGMAEYVSVKAVTQAGIVDQADYEVTQYVILASSPRVPALTELDSQIAFLQGDLSAYALSYFAFADLLDEQGFDAVDSLFSLLREGFGFEQAFEESFGQSTTAFYEEFALRQPTLTESVEPPEEFSTYIIERRSSPVTLVEAPDVLHAGDQVVYQATTEPGTICTLALEKPGASHPQLLQRESFANGQGDVYWLITVPANADRGDAQSILSCGGDQLTIDTPLA